MSDKTPENHESPLDLKAIRARAEAATPDLYEEASGWIISTSLSPAGCRVVSPHVGIQAYADRQLFLHARTDILSLVAELAALKAPGSWGWALEQMKAGKRVTNYDLLFGSFYIVLEGAVFWIRSRQKSVRVNFDLTDLERTDWQIVEEN